jgi:prolyl-tRNA synthetase
LERGVEVGHIFKLGTGYSEAFGATFLDAEGQSQPVIMGSYGMGVERLMQLVVEQHHDERGIRWPLEVAPFDIYLLTIGTAEAVQEAAAQLYAELRRVRWRVLFDDRDERAGVKFNDADLLGLPLRLVVSERLMEDGLIEIKSRSGNIAKVPRDAVLSSIDQVMSRMRADERLQQETRQAQA